MTGPLSGSNKPGEEDSWESLAEDLFGIDFHGGSPEDDLPDDEEDFAPVAAVVEPADSVDDEDDEVELEAGFPDEDEEEAEAGFSEAEEEHDAGISEPEERMRAKAERSKPSPPPEERDSFWDALNDWDWSEAPRRQKPPVPLTSIVDQDDEPAEAPASERKDEPGEGRRRRRGRRRSSVTEPVTASEEPAPIPQRDPEPLPALEDEFEMAAGDDDDEFGAGLLEPARRPSRRPKAPPEPAKRPAGRPSAEGGTRTPARGERSRSVEEPARPSTRPVAEDAEGAGFGEDLDEGEQRPARRRRRRRRRPAESTEAVSPTIDEAPQAPEDIEPQYTENSERPRRRSRTVREQPVEEVRPSQAATSRPSSGVVPTWAEAIALLVHRHPQQTTGWTPESDEGGAERPSRPQSNGGRRRRRRSS